MKHPIAIGKLGSPYGVHGWLRVHSYTDPVDNIALYPNWFCKTKTGWQAVELEDCGRHGKHILAKLSGVDSPEAAKLHVNTELYIERDDLPALEHNDEYYWSDLIGCEVYTTNQELLGTVTDMMDTGSNDVFVVENTIKGGKRHLIPYVSNFVLNVDITNKRIIADWDPDF